MRITKQEWYLFGFLTIFAIVWVLAIIPYLAYSIQFTKLNPVVQYLVYNLGFIMLTIVLINVPFKLITSKSVNLKDMIKIGIAGWLLFSFIFDLWQPPNYLSPDGTVLITNDQALPDTSVDAMLTYLWSFVIHSNVFVHGLSLLYIAVYFITPIIVVGIMIAVLKPSVFKKIILQS